MKLTEEQIEKRRHFEELMRKYFPPNKYPQLWVNKEIVKDIKICKCGICIEDCEYHKPEVKTEEWWQHVGFASNSALPKNYIVINIDAKSGSK
jgi:hypothetical protein